MESAQVRVLPLADAFVESVDGLLVTTWLRTVVDLAAAESFRAGVAVADAALRQHFPNDPARGRAAIWDAWIASPGRKELKKVHRVASFADGAAESVGESESRVSMHLCGLPRPELQHRFVARGRFIARLDFWFPDFRVAGEMDGRMKYLDPRYTGGDPGQAVYLEKRREDAVRAHGVRFVRWGFREAVEPRLLLPLFAAVGIHPSSGSRHP